MKTLHILWTVVCCLGISFELKAQKRRTVLFDTSIIQPLKYVFKSNFQSPITIVKSGLHLHQRLYKNTLNSNQNQEYYIKLNNVSIGNKKISQGDTSVVVELEQKKWNPVTNPLELDGVLASDSKNITFHSSNTSSDAYSLNKQPKLVIDYEVNKNPYGTVWSQQDGNAQHTNQIDWAREGSFNSLKSTEVLKGQKIQYIASYQNKIIVFGKDYLAMLNGNKETWRLVIEELPLSQPVISPDGKMFFVTTSYLVAVDLNEAGRKEPVKKKLSDIKINITKNESHSIKSLPNQITLGYDGTIYLPIAETGRLGIVALSAYPSLKPRWFYNTTNPVGPVSLSQDEKMVFFIETDKNIKKSRLVVMDNVSGEVLSQSALILSSFTNDDVNSYIPPVVVQTAEKDTAIVYVLNGNKTAKELYVFKLHYNQFAGKPTGTLEPHKLFTDADVGKSQPTVLDGSTVLFIDGNYGFRPYKHQNKLTSFIGQSSSMSKETKFETDSKIISNKSPWYYVIPISKGKKMYLLNNRSSSDGYKKEEFDGYVTDIKKDVKSVVTLQDYSVCLLYFDGDIETFYPSNYDNYGRYTIDKIENKTVYINNSMRLSPEKNKNNQTIVSPMTVGENIQAVVVAPQIIIKKDFRVQKGASLTFQIVK